MLVLCQGQHYVPACECQSYCFCSISTLNAVCGGVIDPYCGATVTYCGATDSFCGAIVIHCSSRLLRILMSFSVRRVDVVDAAGQVTTVTYSLSPDSMTTARGYDTMREDPNIYKTLDFFGYSASRYFPDMQLPVPGAPSVSDTTQPSAQQGQFDPEHLSHSRHARRACAFSEASREGSLFLFQRKRRNPYSESSCSVFGNCL